MRRRRSPHLVLLLAAVMLASSVPLADLAQASPRQVVMRWRLASEDDEVLLYRVHIGRRPGVYEMAFDVESFDLESPGVASTVITGIDDLVTYYVTLSAIDSDGRESRLSNELSLPAATCAPAACDDANSCTVDACANGACGHAQVANGSVCDDLDPLTRNDICFIGVCAGVDPPPDGKHRDKKPRR